MDTLAAMVIRPARRDETELLSDLALRSKGHWGYEPDFLEACRAELTIDAGRMDTESVWVACDDDVVLGFSALRVDEGEGELTDLFVDPDHMGSGVGRALWDHTVEQARLGGAARLRIEADPHAEEWYLRRGAVRIGETPSGSIPGRNLPLLEFRIG